ncbi:MAG: response regulator [Pyrinomonadaceae bacterium]
MKAKRSILYLDDESACVDVFQEMFCDEYDVRTVTTLSEARRALEEPPADIVISDQRMPEIEGTEFLREVSETRPASFRVMLTGSAMVSDVIKEISVGVVNLFVSKPWTEEGMRQTLERAGASFELRDKARRARAAQRTGAPVPNAA